MLFTHYFSCQQHFDGIMHFLVTIWTNVPACVAWINICMANVMPRTLEGAPLRCSCLDCILHLFSLSCQDIQIGIHVSTKYEGSDWQTLHSNKLASMLKLEFWLASLFCYFYLLSVSAVVLIVCSTTLWPFALS